MEDIAAIAPLTPVQTGMVFHTLREPEHGVYIVQYTCVVSGPLDVPQLRAAWSETVNEHPALRTVFVFEGLDEPLQVVRRAVELFWTEIDWSEQDLGSQSRQLAAYLDEDRARGFDLARAPLIRLALIRLSEGQHRLVWTYHHAIADGWSSVIVLDEVWKRYHHPGTTSEADGAPGFVAFSQWLANRPAAPLERYWTDRLNGVELPTRLGFALPRGASKLHDRRTFCLDNDTSAALRGFAKRHRLTLSTLVHGAWSAVLGACSGNPAVVYGATVAGRPSAFPGVDNTVGPFISTLPIRVDTTSRLGAVDWLHELQDQLLSLREHETASLTDVARWNGIEGSEIFETLLVFESAPESSSIGPGSGSAAAHISIADEQYFDQSSYPFAMLVHPKDAIELHAVFRQDYIDGDAADTVLELLAETLGRLAGAADAPIEQLIGPTQSQRTALLGSLGTGHPVAADGGGDSAPRDVVAAILAQAKRTPEAEAVVTPLGAWSYAKLASEVQRLSGLLRSRGVGVGHRVGVLAPKSPEFVAGSLAVLAAGAAYVPLDPAYPDNRLQSLLSAAQISTILTLESDPNRPTRLGIQPQATLPLSSDNEESPSGKAWSRDDGQQEERQQEETRHDEQEAYVFFTSGSTGVPKGVRVSHSNLAHSTAARSMVYGATPPRFLVLSPIGFDSSVAGLMWPLTVGGAVVLVTPDVERDPIALGKSIAHLGVTMTLCVPSLYRLILEGAATVDLATLERVIVAGEACPPDVVDEHVRVLPKAALFNEYGPTECTVWSTYARLDARDTQRTIPIGRPIPGAVVRVMDAAGRLVPLGVAGELWVGGAGVALGYIDASASNQRFVPDPQGPVGARLYRTGDRVRMTSDGVLHFVGRIDDQVKVRGFRIEPREVEAALAMIEAISEAVVVARSPSDQRHIQLAAYYTTSDGSPIDPTELRAQLAVHLPAHMVPTSYTHLEQIPRTRRGKIDRDGLGKLPQGSLAESQISARTEGDSASNDVANELRALWRQLLGGEGNFNPGDSFFEVGGDSLLAIRLLGHIRNRWDTDVAMAALFDNPTLEGMGRYIEAVLWARTSSTDEAGLGANDEDLEEWEF